jgi:hypothetical protein
MFTPAPNSLIEQTFTRFLDLPREVRHITWNATFPGERFVQIISTTPNRPNGNRTLDLDSVHWTISSTYPAALSVCHESRELAKARYKAISDCLSVKRRDSNAKCVKFSDLLGVRIDLERETILLGPAHVGHLREHLDLKKIRHLALNSYEELMGTNFILQGTLRRVPAWTGKPDCWTDVWPNLKSLNSVLGWTSRVPSLKNLHWQPKLKLVDINSNFVDMEAWSRQRCPRGDRALLASTPSNFCSIAATLRRHYDKGRVEIEKAGLWEELVFRITVAVHQCLKPKCEDNWHLPYLRTSADDQLVPRDGTVTVECRRTGLSF